MPSNPDLTALIEQYRKRAQAHRFDALSAAHPSDRNYREHTADCYEILASIVSAAVAHAAAVQARSDQLKMRPRGLVLEGHANRNESQTVLSARTERVVSGQSRPRPGHS